MGIYVYTYTSIHAITISLKKRDHKFEGVMGRIHGRVWMKKGEGRNIVTIISKIKCQKIRKEWVNRHMEENLATVSSK